MSDDDFELPEDEEITPASTPGDKTLAMTIAGIDRENVEQLLVNLLARQYQAAALETIRAEAKALAIARVKEVSATVIDTQVREVIEAGWEEMTTWGEKTGKRFTLRAYIFDYIKTERPEHPGRDSYGNPKLTPIEWSLRAAISTVFTTEFEREIDAARTRLRQQIDVVMQGKLADTLKSALGMR